MPAADAISAIKRDAPRGLHSRIRQSFESQRQQRVARQNGGGFAKLFMASGLATAQVVVIERRQIVVNQRISVNKLQRAGHRQNRRASHDSAMKIRAASRHRIGPHALAASKYAVAQRVVNRRRPRIRRRQQAINRGVYRLPVFLEKGGELHSAECAR